VSAGKPVVVLPGFPTSAIFTFHEFVAPVISLLGGRRPEPQELIAAFVWFSMVTWLISRRCGWRWALAGFDSRGSSSLKACC
jgi:molybdopterin biosynthesis enzyme